MAKKTGAPQDEQFTMLGKMLNLITKYGAWNIIKALILIVTFSVVMYSVTHIDDLVQKAFMEQTEYNINQHDAVMNHRKEIKPKIDLLLQNALDNVHADRVFVIELHNGTNNLSGLPFLYCEMTYESCRKGISTVGDEYGSVALSRYNLPYYMNEHRYFMGTVDELEDVDRKLCYRMKANNTTYLCVSNMYGLNNNIGYVGITYVDGNEPASKEELIDEIYTLSQKISTLLDVSDVKYK